METLKTKNGFNVQATNPNQHLYSEIRYKATNESLKKYPYLETTVYGKLKAIKFISPPKDEVKIE